MDMNRGVIQPAGTKGGHIHRLADLTDVVLTDPQPGDVLMFDGSVWRNVKPVK